MIRLIDLPVSELRSLDLTVVPLEELRRFLTETQGSPWRILRRMSRSDLVQLVADEIRKLHKTEEGYA